LHPLLRRLVVLSPLLGAAIRRADRRIENELRHAQATSPDRATTLALRSPIGRWRLSRLIHGGVVHALDAGRYYWDEPGWLEYRRARRRRAFTLLAVLLLGIALFWWWDAAAYVRTS
jgi:hypothetical protein